MSEEGEGEICEVCKDDKFVTRFCSVIGGDKECRELTERAGRGEMTQEQYYARMIDKYGRDKVAMAMEKALVEDKMATTGVSALKQEVPVVEGVERPGGKTSAKEDVKIPIEEEKLATGIADDKEKKEIEERAKVGIPKFRTSQKGLCLPCIGEPASAILSVVKLWYTGKDKEKIEKLVEQMRNGEILVEDSIKEVLKMSGGQDCINATLTDFNKIMDNAVDSALKEKPELRKEKKLATNG